MIGVQSSLVMFPVNILIVGIFRNTRPRETSCCKRRADQSEACSSPTAAADMNVHVTLDTIAKVGANPAAPVNFIKDYDPILHHSEIPSTLSYLVWCHFLLYLYIRLFPRT